MNCRLLAKIEVFGLLFDPIWKVYAPSQNVYQRVGSNVRSLPKIGYSTTLPLSRRKGKKSCANCNRQHFVSYRG
ncbi:hypothetical protein [Alicyclobacillus mengziensis]|uniref:Uncharacterized protein n=1 Tax=Alicyclobacillus mengziensis TaxID=2931921 RepID=A0A9X7Z777_9BACL|nr:hypothetical protein [Alicyclobacillus mengziensis]QSO48107.1 hypothetical protein JZ786_03595 [Alicyclobacillus mengziensis]